MPCAIPLDRSRLVQHGERAGVLEVLTPECERVLAHCRRQLVDDQLGRHADVRRVDVAHAAGVEVVVVERLAQQLGDDAEVVGHRLGQFED
jgi:hypothetical protein